MRRDTYSKQPRTRALFAAVLLSLTLAACATTPSSRPAAGLPAASSAMTLGAPVSAPDGFLNLCMRSPTDCAAEDSFAERIRVAAAAREQSRRRWRALFSARFAGLAGETPAPAAPRLAPADTRPASIGPTAAPAAPAAVAEPAPAAAPAEAPAGPQLEPQTGLQIGPQIGPPAGAVAPLDPATWSALKAVNREVNRKIRKASDRDAFGVEDWWAAPLSQGLAARGDCEDYVLEKRRALIARGLPPRALTIALARTAWGEPHAVLVVATDRGDYVLDNLSSGVKPWRELDYAWTARQAPDDLMSWASLATAP